jgi:hypothetical protein
MSCFCFINYLNNNLSLYSYSKKTNFNINNFLTKNSPFIQFPKAQGDVILRSVEGNNLEVDGDVLMNSLRTPDKIVNSWQLRPNPENLTWRKMVWSPELGIFCVVTNSRVMTSSDGINWELRSPAVNIQWQGIVWSPQLSIFCAVANSGTNNRVMTSPDGINWTSQDTTGLDEDWRRIAWSPRLGLFCVINNASASTINRIMTSPNGINWTLVTAPDIRLWEIIWAAEANNGNGLFVVVGTDGTMTSVDGTNWVTQSVPINGDFRAIAYSPELNRFVAGRSTGGTNFGDRIMYSDDDCVTWIVPTSPSAFWNDSVWSSELGLFCFVSLAFSARIATSPNGINWTIRNVPVPTTQWNQIAWSPELYMFVATAQFDPRLMTTREASKPLLCNASKEVESTTEANTDLNQLSGTTSNIQTQLTATPNVFENDGVPTKISNSKILIGTITTTSTGAVASVTFDPPFNNTPKVFATITNIVGRIPLITNITTTGFTIDSIDNGGNRQAEPYNWVAIGN